MNNSEIEAELIRRYGIDNVILFSEMVAVMFDMLFEHAATYTPEDPCDYDFDREWWTKRSLELKKNVEVDYLT
jgi:hypothetical protein